jgi:hypothetical protein
MKVTFGSTIKSIKKYAHSTTNLRTHTHLIFSHSFSHFKNTLIFFPDTFTHTSSKFHLFISIFDLPFILLEKKYKQNNSVCQIKVRRSPEEKAMCPAML